MTMDKLPGSVCNNGPIKPIKNVKKPPRPEGALLGKVRSCEPPSEEMRHRRTMGSEALATVFETSRIRFVTDDTHAPKDVKDGDKKDLKKKALKVSERYRGNRDYQWIVHPLNFWEIFDEIKDKKFLGFDVRVSLWANPRCLAIYPIEILDKYYPLED